MKYPFVSSFFYAMIDKKGLMIMNKKLLAKTALLSGMVIGFTSICAIDMICKRVSKKKENDLNHLSPEILDWINEQSFEELSIQSDDGLTLHAQLLKSPHQTDKVLIAIHGYHSYNLKEYAYYLKFYHDLGFHILLPDNRAH